MKRMLKDLKIAAWCRENIDIWEYFVFYDVTTIMFWKASASPTKIKIELSFTHRHAVPNLYDFPLSVEHKRCLSECSCCSFEYNESNK